MKDFIKKLSPVSGWHEKVPIPAHFSILDQELVEVAKRSDIDKKDYERIVHYFVEGIAAYKSPNNSQVFYPGISGTRGKVVEGLEGFARSAPLLAAWLFHGNPSNITLCHESKFSISHYLQTGIISGTTPKNPDYWGQMTDYDQRCVEAGDIAVTCWLLQSMPQPMFTQQQLTVIFNWLLQINNVKLHGGNWCLFKLVTNLVALTLLEDKSFIESSSRIVDDCFAEFRSFYVGNGWFGDGKGGFVDYYNVWQMHYYLYWMAKIAPEYESEFIKRVLREFADGYQYMVSPNGIPMFGRSACYRLAAATPLIACSDVNNVYSGIARRALDVTWSHFIEHNALQHGRITQGYYSERVELLENYSGRASPMWSTRSLCLAFMQPAESTFWQAPSEKLPIEVASYSIKIEGPGFRVEGDAATKVITLERENVHFQDDKSYSYIPTMPTWRRLAQAMLRRPLRPENLNIKYGRTVYKSDDFYCP